MWLSTRRQGLKIASVFPLVKDDVGARVVERNWLRLRFFVASAVFLKSSLLPGFGAVIALWLTVSYYGIMPRGDGSLGLPLPFRKANTIES